MSAPASYTEKSLADFMHAELGPVAAVLGLAVGASDAGSYAEAVNETILIYGVSAISACVDIQKLRLLARVQAWRKVVQSLTALYSFQEDGGSYQRGEMFEQAERNLRSVELAAMIYDPNYQVSVVVKPVTNDPYRVVNEDWLD